MKRLLLIVLAALIVAPLAVIVGQTLYEPGRNHASVPAASPAQQLARGQYLAIAGNCMACHTAQGGRPYAGGREMKTPFGTIVTSNITAERDTGIGNWSADDFWRAIHNGKSKDGRFLYPAFPYPSYTKVSRTDADAMYAYLKSLPPVRQENRDHQLDFPYNQRVLLAFWRTLYFRPGTYQVEAGQTAQWNRGAYLVQGLGHCAACHTPRNALGGTLAANHLGGATFGALGWYAGSLTSHPETGLGEWHIDDMASLLNTGVSRRGAVFGPMAEVVRESLQHLTHEDTIAMATYLKTIPPGAAPAPRGMAYTPQDREAVLRTGAKLYQQHCAECHMDNGQGQGTAFPALAGKRSLVASPVNPIRMVLNGGYPPSTAGNPRPYGMPPFGHAFNDDEVAAVVSYLRTSWSNGGSMVSPTEVARLRGVPLE
jgi:mono/diheme cytochrome c family protein